MSRRARFYTGLLICGLIQVTLRAHPTPFSNIVIDTSSDRTRVSVVAYAFDLAMELGRVESTVIEPRFAGPDNARIAALVKERLRLELDGRVVEPAAVRVAVASDRTTATVTLEYPSGAANTVRVGARLFPYDPLHESFVTIRTDGRLAGEAILTADRPEADCSLRGTQSRWDVVRRFVISGVEHIAIGPDHVLFLIGLLLPGGRVWQLVKIVTAFTLAHSITLSLAVLNVLNPPASIVEPAIALTICIVGASNLASSNHRIIEPSSHRTIGSSDHRSDFRVAFAFFFGLIHGFGFASVLRTMNLPRAALGWSLFAFNLGVEIGQLVIVVVVAALLAWVAWRWPVLRRRITVGGSLAVLWAGFYWLVQRLLF